MANTNNKQSGGFILNAFGVAKKFSTTGIELLDHVAPNSVAKLNSAINPQQSIQGQAKKASIFQNKKYDNPEHMLKEHLPAISRQLLGRHFNTVNNVAHFVSPDLSDKVSDYFFDHINDFTNQLSSVDAILNEVGAQELEELTQDVVRSSRISNAFAEQNKWLASIQGALSGATGIVGSAVDIPASFLIALRMIYQVGRSYGFDLQKPADQEVVQYIFKQVDLSLIAEKQALLLALKTLSNTLKSHDLSQLQSMLGSSNDLDSIKSLLFNADGQFKWQWFDKVPKISMLEHLAKLSPLAGAGVGAVYSWRLVDDVNQKAQHVFSTARNYLNTHTSEETGLLVAYEKALALITQANPKLFEAMSAIKSPAEEILFDQDIEMPEHQNMTRVKLVQREEKLQMSAIEPAVESKQADGLLRVDEKSEQTQTEDADADLKLEVEFDQKIQSGIQDLKDQWVEDSVEQLSHLAKDGSKDKTSTQTKTSQNITKEK